MQKQKDMSKEMIDKIVKSFASRKGWNVYRTNTEKFFIHSSGIGLGFVHMKVWISIDGKFFYFTGEDRSLFLAALKEKHESNIEELIKKLDQIFK